MPKFSTFQLLLRKSKLLRRAGLSDLKRTRVRKKSIRDQYEISILSGVGTLIFVWGSIERQLNSLICFYHPHSSDRLRDNGLPDSLKQKIQYLVEIGNDPRVPDQTKLKIKEWIPKLGRLRNHRHLVVHGMMFQKNIGSMQWFAHRLKMNAGWPVVEEVELDANELMDKLGEIGELSHDMAETLNPVFFGLHWRD